MITFRNIGLRPIESCKRHKQQYYQVYGFLFLVNYNLFSFTGEHKKAEQANSHSLLTSQYTHKVIIQWIR